MTPAVQLQFAEKCNVTLVILPAGSLEGDLQKKLNSGLKQIHTFGGKLIKNCKGCSSAAAAPAQQKQKLVLLLSCSLIERNHLTSE